MSTLTDIAAAFKLVSDEFDPIKSTSNNNDIQCINEVLVVCCFGVTPTGKDTGCASGIVLPDGIFNPDHRGISFNFMHDVQADYNPTIASLTTPNARKSNLCNLKNMWAAGMANQNCIRAVELGVHNLILANIESILVQELRNTSSSSQVSRPVSSLTISPNMQEASTAQRVWRSSWASTDCQRATRKSTNSSSTWRRRRRSQFSKYCASPTTCWLRLPPTCC